MIKNGFLKIKYRFLSTNTYTQTYPRAMCSYMSFDSDHIHNTEN